MSLPIESPAGSYIEKHASNADSIGIPRSTAASNDPEKSNAGSEAVVEYVAEPSHRSITTFKVGDRSIYRFTGVTDPDPRPHHAAHHQTVFDKFYHRLASATAKEGQWTNNALLKVSTTAVRELNSQFKNTEITLKSVDGPHMPESHFSVQVSVSDSVPDWRLGLGLYCT
jgi:hypothetical protein